MKYIVKEDALLMDYLIQYSGKKRNDLKNDLKYKRVYINNVVQSHYAYELHIGDTVEIKTSNNTSLDILYEDEQIIVINKPCGLLSERTNNESNKTAYQLVKNYLKTKRENVYLVHRLDQYTSGVLMFVKTKELYDTLTNNWNHYVKTRGYIAIVEGTLKQKQGTIDNYLAEGKSQQIYITSKEKGKRAITHYKVIQSNRNYSMLEVYLDTGRKNQIRVHLSSINHPIIGDQKYNSKTNPIKRLGLHAHEFAFVHPFTHRLMCFKAPVDERFYSLFKRR